MLTGGQWLATQLASAESQDSLSDHSSNIQKLAHKKLGGKMDLNLWRDFYQA